MEEASIGKSSLIKSNQILTALLKIVISGGLVAFLLWRNGIRHILVEMKSADPVWLLLALGVMVVSHVFGGLQWWILLRSENVNISRIKTLSFYFVGLFFNNFLISNLGGDAFRLMDVRRHQGDAVPAVSAVFLDRFLGLFVLSLAAVLTAGWFLLFDGVPIDLRFFLMVMVVGWALLLLLLFNRTFSRPVAWIFDRFFPSSVTVKTRDVYRRIYAFGRKGKLILSLLGLAFVVQGLRIYVHYLVARSLGVELSPVPYFLFIPVIAIVSSLPVSLGGLGLREQMGVILFGSVGILGAKAFSIEFLAYLVAIVSSIPGMFVFIVRRGRK